MTLPIKVVDALDSGLHYLATQHSIEIDEIARDRMLEYIALLYKWNKVYNLTAVRDPVDMVWRHLVDSLMLCLYLPEFAGSSAGSGVTGDKAVFDVIDVGSGAGLPVLPLAMVRPQLKYLSIESNGKKSRFQQQVCLELPIDNVTIVNQRVQDVQFLASFVTSRAFAAPSEFLHLARDLCARHALVAIMLARTDSVPETLPSNFSLRELVPVDIPGTSAPRHIAICQFNA